MHRKALILVASLLIVLSGVMVIAPLPTSPAGPDMDCVVHFDIPDYGVMGSGTIIRSGHYYRVDGDPNTPPEVIGAYFDVLTAYHCLCRDKADQDMTAWPDVRYDVLYKMGTSEEERFTNGVVLYGDPERDLAVLRFQGRVDCRIPKVATKPLERFQEVYITGSTLGAAITSTFGRVTGFWLPTIQCARTIADAHAQPGISGGGVWVFEDGEWKLVGVLVQGFQQGFGFLHHCALLVPLEDLEWFLKTH